VAAGDDIAQRFDPLFMPSQSRQMALFRPTAIAIHHDGNVAWDMQGIGHAKWPRNRSKRN
jgi:hypothetical protein